MNTNINIFGEFPNKSTQEFQELDNFLFLTNSKLLLYTLSELDGINCRLASQYANNNNDLNPVFIPIEINDPNTHYSDYKYIDWCEKNGITYLDTSYTANELNHQGSSNISLIKKFGYKALIIAIGTNGKVDGFIDDMKLMGVPHCIDVHFNQYIGEEFANEYGVIPKNQVLSSIKNHDRIIIKSNAGTGKGYIMKELCSSLKTGGANHEKEFIIYAFPTNSITDQQYQDFANYLPNEEILKLDGRSKQNDIDAFLAIGGSIILSTFDSIHKIDTFSKSIDVIENSILIIDEYHSLVSDIDFRDKKAFRSILSKMNIAKKTILCSATPELIFCENKKLHRSFGYKLIRGVEKTTNKINIKTLTYKSNKGRGSIVTCIHELYGIDKRKVLFKLDNKSTLSSINGAARGLGIECESFWSGDNEKHKSKNDNYIKVCESGQIDSSVKWLSFTTLLEAGVSLKFDCAALVIMDKTTATRAVQLSTRPRYNANTGINKEIDVILCSSDKEKANVKGYKKGCYVDYFRHILSNWQNYKNRAAIGVDTVSTLSDTEDIKLALGDEMETEVCILGLLHIINKELDSVSNADLIKRICRLDNRFISNKELTTDLDQLDELKQETAQQKLRKEFRKGKALEAAKEDFMTLCDLLAFKTKDVDRKAKIRETFSIKFPDKSKALVFADKYPTVIDCKFTNKIVSDTIKIKEAYKGLGKSISIDEAVNLAIKVESKEISSLLSLVNHKKRKGFVNKGTASTGDKIEYFRLKAIRAKVAAVKKDIERGKVLEFQSMEYYTKHINKVVTNIKTDTGSIKLKPLSKTKIKQILEDIYFIDKQRFREGKKRIFKYKICALKTENSVQF